MNASGIRDTARVLHVSPTTVINELTGCEFFVAQELLVLATVEGNSGIRERGGQKNAGHSRTDVGRAWA
jgi:hypothetical protein